MLSFKPSEEQQMLVDAISKFSLNEVRRIAHEADEHSALPSEIAAKGWGLGIVPASIPEVYGGFGEHSALTNVLAVEELAYGDLAAAMAIMLPATVAYAVHFSGTDEQKRNILPQIAELKRRQALQWQCLSAGSALMPMRPKPPRLKMAIHTS